MIPICDGKKSMGHPCLPIGMACLALETRLSVPQVMAPNKAAEQGRLGLPQNTEYLKISWLIMVNYRFPFENEALLGG